MRHVGGSPVFHMASEPFTQNGLASRVSLKTRSSHNGCTGMTSGSIWNACLRRRRQCEEVCPDGFVERQLLVCHAHANPQCRAHAVRASLRKSESEAPKHHLEKHGWWRGVVCTVAIFGKSGKRRVRRWCRQSDELETHVVEALHDRV